MRIRVNPDLCQGHNRCKALAPELFELDEIGNAAAGWPLTGTVADQAGLEAALPAIRAGAGPVFHSIKVKAEDLPLAMPPKDGAFLKDRFRLALLGRA